MIDILLSQIFFFITFAILGLIIAKLLRIDNSLGCLTSGVVASLLLPYLNIDTGIRASNIYQLVFHIILPIIIFSAAWKIKLKHIVKWFWPILFLTILGVVITSIIVGFGVFSLINHAGFPLIAALLVGIILSSTDPTSISASLAKYQAPEELTTIIKSESIFNTTAVVLLISIIFSILNFSESSLQTNTDHIRFFLSALFGGIIIGSVIGLVTAIIALIFKDTSSTSLLIVFSAFASFYIAINFFNVSGGISVTFTAITVKTLLQEHKDKLLNSTSYSFQWLELLFKSILFVIMGLIINFDMLVDQWLAILYCILCASIARIAIIYLVSLINKCNVYKLKKGWALIITFSGMKGAVAIALTLSLPSNLPYLWTIHSMVFGLVLFTLLVQGPIANRLIKRLPKTV